MEQFDINTMEQFDVQLYKSQHNKSYKIFKKTTILGIFFHILIYQIKLV